MNKTSGLLLSAALAIVIALYLPRFVCACDPGAFVPYPVFINTLHPDLPLGSYTRGNLGVIQPSYGSVYLYVAYRNLVGPPVSPSEDAALWGGDERLLTGQESLDPGEAFERQQALQAETHPDWKQAWLLAIGGTKPPESSSFAFSFGVQPWAGVYREIALHESNSVLYSQFLNCPQDAFREALHTLKLRTQQFGEASSVVQNWIEAQKTVFGNCSQAGTVPDDLPPAAPAIARADRAYQQAAAYFYGGEYDKAVTAFRAIAQDQSSPWCTLAPYLVARALVRKATVTDKWGPDVAALAPAEEQIESVLADTRLAQYHHAAEQLRGYIELRLHPDKRIVELADNLTGKAPRDPELAQEVTDFRILFNKAAEGALYTGHRPVRDDTYAALRDIRAKSDLLDWMLTIRLESAGAYNHAFEKWEATHSQAWLVAALTKVEPTSPRASDLLAAAGQVSPHSPAYESAIFHTLRLMLLEGKSDDVRQRLAHLQIRQLGPYPKNLATPPSTLNLLLAMRFALARNLDELLENAPRIPATITTPNSLEELPEHVLPSFGSFDMTAARFDEDSLVVLNHFMPVALLAKAVDSPRLPNDLRGEIALAAWTRAAMIGKASVARSLAVAVESYVPETKASMEAYNSEATPEGQRFAAALVALRFPGLRPFLTTDKRATPINKIDNYRDNWWGVSGSAPAELKVESGLHAIYPTGEVRPPAFLTAKEREEAEQESRHLGDLGPAPNYLSKEAVAWAKIHPTDPRVPEALALAVRSTRYGQTDDNTGLYSKAAFDLLHRRYPQSTWAQQTKYWFR